MSIPLHDFNMPHDVSKEGLEACPPNCPYRIWYDAKYGSRIQKVQKVQEIIHNPEQDAAFDFMQKCGLDPTPDAVEQLAGPFLEALRIMCERGYDPDGQTWRAEGWRGMLWKIRDKAERTWWHGWRHGRFHRDSPIDMINYAGYYVRLAHQGEPWGTRGEPGND